MVAYVIADNEILDPEKYAEYARLSEPALAKYKGRFLARGGKAETLDGSWEPKRIVIIEFDSVEQARAWVNSEEYRMPRQIKHSASMVRTIVVEGLEKSSSAR
jgi:uncharacterized protein (DUF1330 family)